MFALIAELVRNGGGLHQLLLVLINLLDDDVADHGHEDLLAAGTPPSDVLGLNLVVAVGAGGLVVEPAVDAGVVEVVSAFCDE